MATPVLCRVKTHVPLLRRRIVGGEHLLDAGCVPGLVAEGWVERVCRSKTAKPR